MLPGWRHLQSDWASAHFLHLLLPDTLSALTIPRVLHGVGPSGILTLLWTDRRGGLRLPKAPHTAREPALRVVRRPGSSDHGKELRILRQRHDFRSQHQPRPQRDPPPIRGESPTGSGTRRRQGATHLGLHPVHPERQSRQAPGSYLGAGIRRELKGSWIHAPWEPFPSS